MRVEEILRLAAKAAGIHHDGVGYVSSTGCPMNWNPLDDDADSRRLEVDLRIELTYTGEPGDEIEAVRAGRYCVFVNSDLCQGDRRKAAREAIVWVAVDLGMGMQ